MTNTTETHPTIRTDALSIRQRQERTARLAECREGCECPFVMACDRCEVETHHTYNPMVRTLTCVLCESVSVLGIGTADRASKVLYNRLGQNESAYVPVRLLAPDPCFSAATGRWHHNWDFKERTDAGFVLFACKGCARIIEREM